MTDLMQTVLQVAAQHPIAAVLLAVLLAPLLVWLGGVVWLMVKKWPLRYAVWWPVFVILGMAMGGTHGDD